MVRESSSRSSRASVSNLLVSGCESISQQRPHALASVATAQITFCDAALEPNAGPGHEAVIDLQMLSAVSIIQSAVKDVTTFDER